MESSKHYPRDLVRGIAHYAFLRGNWRFYKEDRFYSKGKRKHRDYSWIGRLGAHGIITRDSVGIKQLAETGIPMVSVADFYEKVEGIVEVNTDNNKIAQMAVDYFLRKGFRNFGFCGFKDMPWSSGREKNFVRILKQAGHPAGCYNSSSRRMLNWDREHPNMIKWLKTLPKPVAILCCNDDRGNDLVEACKAGGFKVPFEIAVLGIDDDYQVCDLSNPPLSSVSLSTKKAGYKAAEILDRMMSGKKPDTWRIIVNPLEVVSRQSTDTMAISDPQVAQALQFINENSRNIIQVSDVSNVVGCSRKGIDKKFQRFLGHTVFAEIRRVRTEAICHMLHEADLSITQIALQLGYNDSDHIARFFKQEMNMTPMAYRKKFL